MPGSRRSRRVIEDDDDNDAVEIEEDDEEEVEQKPSPKKKSRLSGSLVVEEEDDEDEGEDDTQEQKPAHTENTLTLCSQAPDATQEIQAVRETERNKFLSLNEERREKAVSDVLRLVLFKGLSGDPIDRLKIAKEAHINEERISGAVFEEVNIRLENLFALKLQRVPAFFENMKDFPAKCKDRYYLVNMAEDPTGSHTKSLHMVDKASSIEKGLLMTILAFIFCKGDARSDGSRWLLDKELYRLLHNMDENLPPEPPVAGTSRKQSHKVEGSPDVDSSLDRFVRMDFLFRIKANEQLMALNDQAEDTSCFYTMGTRSAIEVGRLQVVHFVSQTLGEEIPQEILDEINAEEEE